MGEIEFRQVHSTQPVVDLIFRTIHTLLEKNASILWLIGGGSAIEIAIQVASQLNKSRNLEQLTVTLTDERYGPVGHRDSNWKQLQDRGFKLDNAKLLPVLTNKDFEQTANSYGESLNKALSQADYSLALAGMGPDGHIFGIKPNSPAVDSRNDVVAYKWDDYQRITPTASFISRLDEVIIYASGEEKHQQIADLEKELSLQEQPAQLLKKLQKVTIFNNHIGGKV
ncbi:6-phosphogluconolactonase [Candidatus Saccharibacteria bacterium]|nr:6-phosphogluconolactonase [Candidatus Saccharibacteria bacterium]